MLKRFCQQQAGRVNLRTTAWVLHGLGASVAALILLAGHVGHRHLFSRYQILRAEHDAAVDLRARADLIATANQITQAKFADAQAYQQQVFARIPRSPNEIAFLDLLSATATRTGLQIRDYRPGTRSEHPTHHEIELILRAEGSYESLCHFVASLEALPRMCRVSNLSVSAPQPGKTEMTIELRIALVHGLKPQATI